MASTDLKVSINKIDIVFGVFLQQRGPFNQSGDACRILPQEVTFNERTGIFGNQYIQNECMELRGVPLLISLASDPRVLLFAGQELLGIAGEAGHDELHGSTGDRLIGAQRVSGHSTAHHALSEPDLAKPYKQAARQIGQEREPEILERLGAQSAAINSEEIGLQMVILIPAVSDPKNVRAARPRPLLDASQVEQRAIADRS